MLLDDAIAALNERLKAGRHRCRVQRMNQRLYLRATLPSRSGGASSQQRLPIGNATPIELAQAEVLAIQLSLEIQNGTFAWKNWIKDEEELKSEESKTHTIQDFIKAAERLHASKYAKNPERGKESWNKFVDQFLLISHNFVQFWLICRISK